MSGGEWEGEEREDVIRDAMIAPYSFRKKRSREIINVGQYCTTPMFAHICPALRAQIFLAEFFCEHLQ